jgi:hypothetical protein
VDLRAKLRREKVKKKRKRESRDIEIRIKVNSPLRRFLHSPKGYTPPENPLVCAPDKVVLSVNNGLFLLRGKSYLVSVCLALESLLTISMVGMW